MERTKPKNAGWQSFRLGFETDKKKPDEEEHKHTPETSITVTEQPQPQDSCLMWIG